MGLECVWQTDCVKSGFCRREVALAPELVVAYTRRGTTIDGSKAKSNTSHNTTVQGGAFGKIDARKNNPRWQMSL